MVFAMEKWIIPIRADIEDRSGAKTFAEAIVDCGNKINLTANFVNMGTVDLTAKFIADIYNSTNLITTLESSEQNVSVNNTAIFSLSAILPSTPTYATFTIIYDFVERGLGPHSLNVTQNETFINVCRRADKWWSDTENLQTPINSFDIVFHNDTHEITSTNPGGFFININVTSIPNTSSISIIDVISDNIRPTGDFEGQSGNPIHVYIDGNQITGTDVTNKFDRSFNGTMLNVTLKPGEFVGPASNLYVTLHLKYALTSLNDTEIGMFPHLYINLASVTINSTTTYASPAVITAYLKFVGAGVNSEPTGPTGAFITEGGGSPIESSNPPQTDNSTNVTQNDTSTNETNVTLDTVPPQYNESSISGTQVDTLVTHSVYWTDDNQLSGYVFSFDNCIGEYTNETWIAFADNWSNVSKQINSTPDCTTRWKVYANDSSDNWNVTEDFTYVTTSPPLPQDTSAPTWSDSSNSDTLAGTDVMHSVLWNDDVQLSGYIFSFDNCEGSPVNDTWVPFTDNWSNVTKTLNSTANCTINWMVYANDTSDNWAATNLFTYTTTENIVP